MADLESDIRLALRQIRFGQNETAIKILERILDPEVEVEPPTAYPKWIRHPEDKREVMVRDEDHEEQTLDLWGLKDAKKDAERKEDSGRGRGGETKERVPAQSGSGVRNA